MGLTIVPSEKAASAEYPAEVKGQLGDRQEVFYLLAGDFSGLISTSSTCLTSWSSYTWSY
jgi:hypothetical protein